MRTEVPTGRLVAAFYPYGSGPEEPAADAAGPPLDLGVAAVVDRERGDGLEHYALSRVGDDWLLHSRLFAGPPRLVARARAGRLPPEPAQAAVALLLELWALRQPSRLCFAGPAAFGEIGSARWQDIDARLRPALEDQLRAEGHQVRSIPGPMGTQEHLLVFPRPPAGRLAA